MSDIKAPGEIVGEWLRQLIEEFPDASCDDIVDKVADRILETDEDGNLKHEYLIEAAIRFAVYDLWGEAFDQAWPTSGKPN